MTLSAVAMAAPAVAVEDQAPAHVAKTDMSQAKKERVERVKRPEKPDRTELDSQVEKLHAQIDQCQARITQIKVLIDQKKDSRKHVGSGGFMARSRLAELRQDYRSNLDVKNALRTELAASDAARDKLREEAKGMRDKLSFVKVEQIDDEIAKLEHKMTHTTINIDEERRTVEQIKQLRKSRDLVKVYNERLDRLHEDDSQRRHIMDQIRAKDQDLNQNKEEEGEQRQILEGVRAKEDAETADIPGLVTERNESYEIVREGREAVRTLRTEFKALEDTYYQQERLYRAQTREEKQKQWEVGQAERKERAERRKEWELENAPPPFDKEVTACEQLLGYLGQFDSNAASTTPQPAAAAPLSRDDLAEFKPKTTEKDEDPMFLGLGGGKKAKKGKKGAKKEEKDETLSFSLDALGWLSLLKMKPPLTKTLAVGLIQPLLQKKEHWLEKRALTLLNRQNGIQEKAESDDIKVVLAVDGDSITVTLQ